MMEKSSAIRIIQNTFEKPFDKEQYRRFIKELFNHLDESNNFLWAGNRIPNAGAFQPYISSIERIGKYQDTDGKKIDCLIVNLKKETALEHARTRQRNFVARYLQGHMGGDDKDAALVAFVSPDSEDWRFSLVKVDYSLDMGKLKTELTPARRYSFLVGENESSHTAQLQLLPILQEDKSNPLLSDFEKAFSIEVVTKEFFTKYRELYYEVEEALQNVVKKDAKVRDDFQSKGVDTVNFAKKLLGQIVFLYFLQKKGWFGVPRNGEWGQGSKNFLRELFEKKHGDYRNFFNDILELLFYDALRRDRSEDDHYYPHFNCKIPFLNGGLFDPMNDYDWVGTEILLPNQLFSNSEKTKEGDTGTGILDVFDRYNFTVKEDEPLDKEVAVDPEMLGKVFENLLEVKDRKSKGTYYTPREIVHYMCQESLINYLDTAVNSGDVPLVKEKSINLKLLGAPATQQMAMKADGYTGIVPREDIETFVRMGELAVEHDARVESTGKETKDYSYKLPASIRLNAGLIDYALADIRVCDPAAGSGAFPVGLMSEIVRARKTLTTYLPDKENRNSYHFKRHAIQNCLYGVDIDPSAVEIAKLRLWLSLVVDEEDIRQIQPLPNLDYKIVCGNSLLGVERNMFNNELFQKLEDLKPLYFNETNAKKKQEFRKQINQLINRLTNDNRIFDFEVYFSEVFHKKGGFDVVIANPPYDEVSEKSQKDYYKTNYSEVLSGHYDLYIFFFRRAFDLGRNGATASFITPHTYLLYPQFQGLRSYLYNKSQIHEITSRIEGVFESAVVDNAIIVFSIGKASTDEVTVFSEKTILEGILLNLGSQALRKSEFCEASFDLKAIRNASIVKKLSQGAELLGDVVDSTQGITVYAKVQGEKVDHFRDKLTDKTCKPVTRGREITKYRLDWSDRYIRYGNWLWCPRDPRFFESPRIFLRQTADTLIGTYVEFPMYCIDSVHSLIAKANKADYSLKYILGILNSKLGAYIYGLLICETGKVFAQVKLIFLRRFPIKSVALTDQLAIVRLVDQVLTTKEHDPQADTTALEWEIDQLVYRLYGLTPEEIAVVEGNSGK